MIRYLIFFLIDWIVCEYFVKKQPKASPLITKIYSEIGQTERDIIDLQQDNIRLWVYNKKLLKRVEELEKVKEFPDCVIIRTIDGIFVKRGDHLTRRTDGLFEHYSEGQFINAIAVEKSNLLNNNLKVYLVPKC